MFQQVARVERQGERDAGVQHRDDHKHSPQPECHPPIAVARHEALQPPIDRPGQQEGGRRQVGRIQGLVGQRANQLEPAIPLGLDQFLGRHGDQQGIFCFQRLFGRLHFFGQKISPRVPSVPLLRRSSAVWLDQQNVGQARPLNDAYVNSSFSADEGPVPVAGGLDRCGRLAQIARQLTHFFEI